MKEGICVIRIEVSKDFKETVVSKARETNKTTSGYIREILNDHIYGSVKTKEELETTKRELGNSLINTYEGLRIGSATYKADLLKGVKKYELYVKNSPKR